MADCKPRPIWFVLIAALILLLYFASFGPACWISYGNHDRWITVNSVFRPLLVFTRQCEPVRRGLERYANLAAPSGSRAFIHDGAAIGD